MTIVEVLSGPEKGESWNGMRYLLGLSERKSREVYWTHRDDHDRRAEWYGALEQHREGCCLGVEPGEVLFIDDREDNIAGART